jgi:predicted RNase H-like HicB family nuclease
MNPTPRRVTASYSIDDDGRTWLVALDEEERVHSYGRSFLKARANILEAAALWFNVDEGDLEMIDQLPPSYQEPLDELAEARARLEDERAHFEAVQADVKERTIDAILMLRTWSGLSNRDVAAMIGLSHQRVHQLATEVSASG